MLSYRHVYHAGNFADVHKHAALLCGLDALRRKAAPFCVLDVYAGAGSYDLGAAEAEKTGEWRAGVGRLAGRDDLPPPLAAYLEQVRAYNNDGALSRYPGSPALAAAQLRATDRLICLELHPADHAALAARFAADKRVQVHRRDAREGLPALLPPAERRGLVLIDPPYERAEEYSEVPAALRRAQARWPNGSYLVWYPLLAAKAHEPMVAALATGDIRKVLVQELLLFPEAGGLRGSGLLWINPPWQTEQALAEAGDWLGANLGAANAHSRLEWRVPE